MLPSDNTKRFLLQRQLLQRRLADQLAAARQMQTPSSSTTTSVPTPLSLSASLASSPSSTRHAAVVNMHQAAAAMSSLAGLGRNSAAAATSSLGFHQQPTHQQQQSSLLQRLLEVDQQERKLKRRLSEMQYQQQIQQQQQTLLQATQGRIVRRTPPTLKKDLNPFSTAATTTSAVERCQRSRHQHAELLANIQQKAALRSSAFFQQQNASDSLVPSAAASRDEHVESRQTCTEKGRAQEDIDDAKDDREGSGETEDEDREREPAEMTVDAEEKPVSGGGVSRKDSRWHEMYDELQEYRKKTGTCTVPRGYPENPRLASWVAEQRKQYKLMKDGRQSSITPDRVELLNKVDFAWNAQEAAWEKHMSDLKEFKNRYGHCHCPLGDPNFPKLGLWVKEQRRHYTLMKQGKQSHMTEARCAELDAVGFCWDTHEATWLERLNELRDFKAVNGHCTVPTNYRDNPKLGTWIHHQRRQYKKYKEGKPCHITAERIRALDSLGFVWHPRDKTAAPTTTDSCSSASCGETRDPEPEIAADLTNLDLRPRKRQRS